MANTNCAACEELRNDAPNLIVNGITNTEIASLKNNTGFNPSSGNDDCTDLNNANDCFIGNMEAEVDAYDVCDWKPFMKRYIPNEWTVNKSIISAICGLWAGMPDMTDIEKRLKQLCALLEATNKHPVHRYGILNNSEGDQNPTRRGGTIGQKNGSPLLVPMLESELDPYVWAAQNVGINWGVLETEGCTSGRCLKYEWISPSLVGYKFNPDLTIENGDILWYVDKTTAQGWGLTDEIWNAFDVSSWTWYDYAITNRTLGWFRLDVDRSRMGANYLTMVYLGSTYPNNNPAGYRINEPEEPDHLYTWNC